MEKQDDIRERLITANNDLAEDLSDWAWKVKALGGILSAFLWHESRGAGGTGALRQHGEAFGEIIKDYAEFIETSVSDNISRIRGQESAETQLVNHQEVYASLKDTKRHEDIYVIDQHLHGLSSFIQNHAMPAIKLRSDFEDIKKRLTAKQQKTANIQ